MSSTFSPSLSPTKQSDDFCSVRNMLRKHLKSQERQISPFLRKKSQNKQTLKLSLPKAQISKKESGQVHAFAVNTFKCKEKEDYNRVSIYFNKIRKKSKHLEFGFFGLYEGV